MAYRKAISTSIYDITRGIGFGDNGSLHWLMVLPGLSLMVTLGTVVDGNTALADIVARGSYFLSNDEARGRFINNPYCLEECVVIPLLLTLA